jgi:hypothetical protein
VAADGRLRGRFGFLRRTTDQTQLSLSTSRQARVHPQPGRARAEGEEQMTKYNNPLSPNYRRPEPKPPKPLSPTAELIESVIGGLMAGLFWLGVSLAVFGRRSKRDVRGRTLDLQACIRG